MSARLNREQLAAIGMCLRRPPLAVVYGPPGTGKTTAVSSMLAHMLLSKHQPRVLVVAQTNVATELVLVQTLLKAISVMEWDESRLQQIG